MRVIVLYSTPIEGRFLGGVEKYEIGINATRVPIFDVNPDLVIIYGSCGLLRGDYTKLFMPRTIIHEDEKLKLFKIDQRIFKALAQLDEIAEVPACMTCKEPVHSGDDVQNLKALFTDGLLLDQESYFACLGLTVQGVNNYVVLRYPVDMCNKKLKPKGINFFYRYWTHFRNAMRINDIVYQLEAAEKIWV